MAGANAVGINAMFPPVLGPWVSQVGGVQVAGTGLSKGLAHYYGMKVVEGKAQGLTRARYYPGGMDLVVKLLVDQETHRMVGAQIIGGEDVTGRINWVSAAIYARTSIQEFIAGLENAHCPPTTMVKDVVKSAAEDAVSKL